MVPCIWQVPFTTVIYLGPVVNSASRPSLSSRALSEDGGGGHDAHTAAGCVGAGQVTEPVARGESMGSCVEWLPAGFFGLLWLPEIQQVRPPPTGTLAIPRHPTA